MKVLSALHIKKSSAENLEEFDAFKNVLIAGQDVQFDIWRYVDKKATKIVLMNLMDWKHPGIIRK